MTDLGDIQFIDNKAAHDTERYTEIVISADAAVKSWQNSVFSFEWLTPEGEIKAANELSEAEKVKRDAVEAKIKSNEPIEKAVLGIGLEDNVEIGSARAEFLTLAALGVSAIPVHIPKSNESDFQSFLADVDS